MCGARAIQTRIGREQKHLHTRTQTYKMEHKFYLRLRTMPPIPLLCFCWLLCCGSLVSSLQKPGLFRQELFPEQLLQQQLQLKQGAVQEQLQQLQKQLQINQQNNVAFQSLVDRQNSLLQELANIQKDLMGLQQKLQDELGGGIRFEIPDQEPISRPSPTSPVKTVTRTENLPTIGPSLDDNSLSPQQPSDAQSGDLPPIFTPDAVVPSTFDDHQLPCASTIGSGFCKPLVQCLAFYADIPELRKRPCVLREGEFGVCCPPFQERTVPVGPQRTGVLVTPPPPFVVIPSFTPEQIEQSVAAALEKIEIRNTLVSNLLSHRILVQTNSAAAGHQKLFPTTNETLEIGEHAQKTVAASVELVNDFKLTPEQGTFALPKFSILNTVLADTCPKQAFCRAHKYRSTDGSCNNLNNQRWGAPGTALQRILAPKYGDGVNSARSQGDDGNPLPSPRLVSVFFAQTREAPSENLTLALMQWGQFVSHDLTHTPISRGQSGFGISCCRSGRVIEASLRHPDCFAIELPTNDHVFARFGEQCMEFVRSLPAPRPECNFGPREQMNQITGYQDGSAVYASNLEVQKRLRTLQGGRLRSQNIRGKELLPANPTECSDPQRTMSCFSAGDGRVNEQVELALMHIVWLREHNRIADILAQMHPNWSDDAIFQETRRIVIAEIQHITYNEYLPLILGPAYVDNFELRPKRSGWTQFYDPQLNPGITNVFATAAFRFGHSLIPNNLLAFGKFGNIRENLQLSKQHFAPFSLYRETAIDDFIRGFTFQNSESFDRFFAQEVTDHLFQGNLNFGLDLVSLNIQRGRDHGLPPYNDWREVCGLKKATIWDDLEDVMDSESIRILARLYRSVQEVDLYAGGLAERSVPGAVLGPTFTCLVGDQFSRLRRGDRFFYEEGKQPSSFSSAQLNEIRKVSLARILCDNSDNIVLMQPLAFQSPSFLNQRVPCDSPAIPKVDLRAWQNEIPAVP